MDVVHVLPAEDLIEHEDHGIDCICGVDIEYLIGCCGQTAKVITHHSLDGRELYEAYRGPA